MLYVIETKTEERINAAFSPTPILSMIKDEPKSSEWIVIGYEDVNQIVPTFSYSADAFYQEMQDFIG